MANEPATTTVRCAHGSCSCSMTRKEEIVEHNGNSYCSEGCANGKGCTHSQCGCGA